MAKNEAVRKKLLAKFMEPSKKKVGSADRVSALIESGVEQVKIIEKLIAKDASTKIVAQRDWFREVENGQYEIKVGRTAYPFNGDTTKRFKATSLEEVKEIVEGLVELAKTDDDFQKEIRDYQSKPKAKAKK